MQKSRAILVILFWLFGVIMSWPQSSRAFVPLGSTWDDVPLMSLNLNVNDPADQAGQTDPWNDDAANALSWWGDDWLGNGTLVPGASFIFNYDFTDQNECDRTTDERNAVEWNNFTAVTNPPGLMTTCGEVLAPTTLAVAFTSFYTASGLTSNSDVLFNSNSQWTTADPGVTNGSPFSFNTVAMHEFGHVLGLNHEDNTLARMNSIYYPGPRRLHADDRLGVRSLYPGSGTETDIGPSVWKKTDGSSVTPAIPVSSPTASVQGGQSFTMEWTQENFGTTDVGFNIGFFLSANNFISTSDTLVGRTLGAFQAAGTSDTFSIALTVPLNISAGTYFLGVCLDDDHAVAETSEGNNCVAYPQTVTVIKPDLVVSALGNPPASVPAGGTFSVTDTTANIGTAPTEASTTRYWLSADATITPGDLLLPGSRSVPALSAGGSSTGTVTITLPLTLGAGTYFLGACADDATAVVENNETNNCRAAATTFQVTAQPNLVVSALNNPPASVPAGAAFSVTDTTTNQGNLLAGASTTRYRLSTDTTITSADLLLTGSRSVPALAAGGSSTGTVTVTIPATVAAGTYFLGACADDTNVVAEPGGETDNCRAAATTIQVTVQTNLVVSALNNPPASVPVGATFGVTDTTTNQGNLLAGASTTRYRLSIDTTITSADLLLPGSRSVPALAAGGSSTGTVTVRIPSTVAAGTYFLGACADDTNVVAEPGGETDNCRASVTTMLVTVYPNLQMSALSNPPASVAVGDSFSVTDTTENQGTGPAGASTTRYRLSTDTTITSADLALGSRSVPALVAGGSSTGTVTVTMPLTVAVGTYFLGACADDTNVVAEPGGETNNCRASATTMLVIIPLTDLVEAAVTDPPSTVEPGDSFSVTDTVLNQGNGTAGASTTYYYLSLDALKDEDDILLTGDRSVPSLAYQADSTGTATVTIPATLKTGFSYFLLACADDTNQVVESDEKRNCLASGTTVEVK